MYRRPLIVAAAAALMISGAALAAPAAGSDDADSEPGSAQPANPDDLAIDYVRQHADDLGVTPADLRDVYVLSSYTSRHNGVRHVNLNQRYQGLDVFGGHATVNVTNDGDILFVGDNFVANLRAAGPDTAELDAVDAVEAAAEALDLDQPRNLRVMRTARTAGGQTTLSRGGISDEPITARQGWQPTADGLRLAWQLVIDDSSDDHLWNATIDAATGALLEVDDWTDQDTYASLATTLARPAGARPASALGTAAAATDGSSYRVYELPKNDPNEGPRGLVVDPAHPEASPFGWHDTDGVFGPEFTTTQGNNAHAYTDRDANNQPDPGSEADGGPGLAFDFAADLNEHPQTYLDASVTNLFYWCNTVHDLFSVYGFDEAAGNFQVTNYTGEGAGGDDVRCEGHDGSGHNNANFSTPAVDGGRPRMQMFLWPGYQFGLPNAVTIDAGPAAGTYGADYARFSPAPTSAGLAGTLVQADDGVGPNPHDGCQPYTLPAGSIAVVDQASGVPGCNFYTQTVNAENAGAAAVVVANTGGGADPGVMSGSMNPAVGIPAVRVSAASAAAIKAGLPAAGSVHRNTDRPPMRDADFRNETIFHEYGHGLSNRLTGGPTVNCLSGQEQMGEGWSDYVAIAGLLRPDLDDPEGPRGYGQYALFADSRVGDGFRPRPYSRNMSIQPFTYDSIKTGGWLNGTSLAAPHGIGHGWAAVLWDMTWDLIDKHGFNPNVFEPWHTGGNNLAYQLVIDGLKIQGCGPTFVTGRDAILAADDVLTGGANNCTLWASFARRGLGYSADDGNTTGRDDGSQAFDTHPDCAFGFAAPVAAQPALNTVGAGRTVPMMFSRPELTGTDVLASNSPYSRQVNCETLATEVPGSPFITPGALPVAAKTAGGSALTRSMSGRYTFPWQTEQAWVDTCREFILTLDNGEQHRAYFQFVEAE